VKAPALNVPSSAPKTLPKGTSSPEANMHTVHKTPKVLAQDIPRPVPCHHEPLVGGTAISSAMDELAELFYPKDDAVPVVHGLYPHIKQLWIPSKFLHLTKADHWNLHHQQPGLSVCLKYDNGCCKQGAHCTHVHISRSFSNRIAELMAVMQTDVCCSNHSPKIQAGQPALNGVVELAIAPHLPTVLVPRGCLSPTLFWPHKFWSNEDITGIRFHSTAICEPHLNKACPLGAACGAVHVCRKFWKDVVEPIQGPDGHAYLGPGTEQENPKPSQEPRDRGLHAVSDWVDETCEYSENVDAHPKRQGPKNRGNALPIVDPKTGAEVRIPKSHDGRGSDAPQEGDGGAPLASPPASGVETKRGSSTYFPLKGVGSHSVGPWGQPSGLWMDDAAASSWNSAGPEGLTGSFDGWSSSFSSVQSSMSSLGPRSTPSSLSSSQSTPTPGFGGQHSSPGASLSMFSSSYAGSIFASAFGDDVVESRWGVDTDKLVAHSPQTTPKLLPEALLEPAGEEALKCSRDSSICSTPDPSPQPSTSDDDQDFLPMRMASVVDKLVDDDAHPIAC